MKVLVVHNAYQNRSGEEAVVSAETRLLEDNGHDVHLAMLDNESISGLAGKVKTLIETPYSWSGATWLQALLAEHRPEVVHFHNFFPLISPAGHEIAARSGAAVVQSLHNYRTICAAGTLLRNGLPCEKCVGGARAWGLVHRCYRGSVAGSAALVAMQLRADATHHWHRFVHRFIVPTAYGRSVFLRAGFPADRTMSKPHFVFSQEQSPQPRSGALFVGRISPEKGLATAIEAFRAMPDYLLTVIGDGPERQTLERGAPSNVRFLGRLPSSQVNAAMQSAEMLLVPSIWLEPFGMTVIEAYAAGLPVVASDVGPLAELVAEGITGARFKAGDADSLRQVVMQLRRSGALTGMGAAAREHQRKYYSPEANIAQLEAIYREAIGAAKAG